VFRCGLEGVPLNGGLGILERVASVRAGWMSLGCKMGLNSRATDIKVRHTVTISSMSSSGPPPLWTGAREADCPAKMGDRTIMLNMQRLEA
jgi:hypothetical protein